MLVDHSKNLIEVNKVSFSYGEQNVLTDVSLAVHQGDYLALVGPNGAGKTTLLKLMLGLLVPDKGEIKLFGQEASTVYNNQRLGYVPQQSSNISPDFPISVYDVVALGRYRQAGLGRRLKAVDKQVIKEVLNKVGMWPYKDVLIGNLSGGQQQRCYIARALSGQPEIIFLDEPTRGLDQLAQDSLYSLIRDLNKEGLTIVTVSHDVGKMTQEAMHIACLDHRLVCHNSPAEFLADSSLMEMFGQKVKIIGHHHH